MTRLTLYTAALARMMQMQGRMMGNMMQHMSPEMQKMMAECPMMKQMGTAK
ncbi:MAG: hypothetical protein HY655_10570 [Acidobacteria bacterium]|nr:hypothetical protein [Acidobacteriota bacterium]